MINGSINNKILPFLMTRQTVSLIMFKYRSSHRSRSINVFLKTSQNSQKNTCGTVSYLIISQASTCSSFKKETLVQVFSCEFCEIFKNTLFTEHIGATTSAIRKYSNKTIVFLLFNSFTFTSFNIFIVLIVFQV